MKSRLRSASSFSSPVPGGSPRTLCGLICLFGLLICGCGGGGGGGNSSPYRATFLELPVPVVGNVDATRSAWPDDLDSDSQGNLWFALNHADEIGRMTRSGTYTGFPVATTQGGMDGIAVDNTRKLVWVTETNVNQVARLDMNTGRTTEIPMPTPNSEPGDIRVTPAGTVWLGEGYLTANGKGGLARIDPNTNLVQEFSKTPGFGLVDGLQLDADATVWFVELEDNKLAHYTNGQFIEYAFPRTNVVLTNMTIDGQGHIWLTEQTGNMLASFDPVTVAWREFPIPTPRSGPSGIAADSFGNIWFTEFDGNKIGVLPAGSSTIVDFAIPTAASGPEDVHIQADGTVWFTERFGNKIGQITVTGLPGRP